MTIRIKKIVSFICILSLVLGTATVYAVDVDNTKIARTAYVHAHGNIPRDQTPVWKDVYLGDNATVYLSVDNPNKGVDDELESQYNMNGYRVKFYYDPSYLEILTNNKAIDFSIPFTNVDVNENVNKYDPKVVQGVYIVSQGTKNAEVVNGRTYATAYLFMLLSGIKFPEKDPQNWYNLCMMPFKTLRTGTTDVFIELDDYTENGYGLELIAKHRTDYPFTFNTNVVNNGSVTLNIMNRPRPTPPVPSPLPGNYTQTQEVSLSTTEKGDIVEIWYTLNENAPSNPGDPNYMLYTGPITITKSSTIKCYTRRVIGGYEAFSFVPSYVYKILPIPPVLFFDDKTRTPNFYADQNVFNVTFDDDEDPYTPIAATNDVYYTFTNAPTSEIANATENSDPNTGWVKVSKLHPTIPITKETKIRAVTVGINEMSEETFYYLYIKPQDVIADPLPDPVDQQKVNVSLSCPTIGAAIYYTIDGTDPRGGNAILYTGAPIPVNENTVIRAVSKLDGLYSNVTSYYYQFKDPPHLVVRAFHPPGTYEDSVLVSLTSTNYEDTIYYTLDGSTPTQSSSVFGKTQILTLDKDTVIKAIAVSKDGEVSDVYEFAYRIKPKKPVIIPPSTQFYMNGDVHIMKTQLGSEYRLFYTIDGTDPTLTTSNRLEAPGDSITLSIGQYTRVSAVVLKDGIYSDVVTEIYDIVRTRPAKPIPTLVPGEYIAPNSVVKVFSTQFLPVIGDIYYTIGNKEDGTYPPPDPSLTNPLTKKYNGEDIIITGETMIKAVVVNAEGVMSDIGVFNYKIIPEAPVAPQSSVANEIDVVPVETVPNSNVTYKLTLDNGSVIENTVRLSNGAHTFYLDMATGRAYLNPEKTIECTYIGNPQTFSVAPGSDVRYTLDLTCTLNGVSSLTNTYVYIVRLSEKGIAPTIADRVSGDYDEIVLDGSDDEIFEIKLNTVEAGGIKTYKLNNDEWKIYTGPIRLKDDAILFTRTQKEIDGVLVYSETYSYMYTFIPLPPIITPMSGIYSEAQNVVLTIDPRAPKNNNYQIYYRKNGDPADVIFVKGLPITIDHSMALKAYVVKNDNVPDKRRLSAATTEYYVITTNLIAPRTNLPTVDDLGEPIVYAKGQTVRFINDYANDPTIALYYTMDMSSPSDPNNPNRIKFNEGDVITLTKNVTLRAVYAKYATEEQEGNVLVYGPEKAFNYLVSETATIPPSPTPSPTPSPGGSSGGSGGGARTTPTPSPSPSASPANYDIVSDDKVITGTQVTVNVGADKQAVLHVNGKPVESGVKWSSSNPDVATVDENGLVHGVSPGFAIITAEYDGKTYHFIVEIKAIELVPDHIVYLYGYPDKTVRSTNPISRSEFSAIIYRLLKPEYQMADKGPAPFSDIPENAWFVKEVACLASFGIVQGYPDGTFRPDNYITREELLTVIVRFSKIAKLYETALTDVEKSIRFSDIDGSWATGFIEEGYSKGFVKGYPDGTFRGRQNITREETVTVVNRMTYRHLLNDATFAEFPDLPDYVDLKDKSYWAYRDIMEASVAHLFDRGEKDYEIWRTGTNLQVVSRD